MSRESGQRVAVTLRDGRLIEMKGAYHHLVLDDPDRFVTIVSGWLAEPA
ncbi:MAG TPA: hypothetical protein VJX92_05755 [Methylomirabilota bacterium]|nr:hypothetical protein [Methylomirabilota bacterium]